MTYNIKNLSPETEQLLRERAEAEQKTVERVICEVVEAQVASKCYADKEKRDLSDLAGQDTIDAAVRSALQEQRQIAMGHLRDQRDLSFLADGPPLEPEVLAALKAQRRIDPEIWK